MSMKTSISMKYSVLLLDEKFVSKPIFETPSLPEALEKVREQNNVTNARCVIVSCPEDGSLESKESGV